MSCNSLEFISIEKENDTYVEKGVAISNSSIDCVIQFKLRSLMNFTILTVDLLQMLEFNMNVTFPVASFFTVILALVGKSPPLLFHFQTFTNLNDVSQFSFRNGSYYGRILQRQFHCLLCHHLRMGGRSVRCSMLSHNRHKTSLA